MSTGPVNTVPVFLLQNVNCLLNVPPYWVCLPLRLSSKNAVRVLVSRSVPGGLTLSASFPGLLTPAVTF
ncbi:hypothetical protein Q5P01_020155 [Channa striata]|uniref:Uncharacterized protein n=1 Tax=Channa striata TaxID=64152 RepID=A0AA88SB27_CHASR|nr:hypothetical protein Q5P01_020155 [Channa striata]